MENWLEDTLGIASIQDLGWGWRILVIVFLTLLLRALALRILTSLGRQFRRTENVWDDALFEAARPVVSWFILIMGLCLAADVADNFVDTALLTSERIDAVRRLSVIVLIMCFAWRFILLVEEAKLHELQSGEPEPGRLDATTLTALAKLLRLTVVISAVLIALPTLGIEITALLAAGGVGGIAIGFAAQDLLSNFFGGLMIYLDRPFAIGDWIRSPDREIEGTVEQIGWRLTVVRTFDKRPLYVPNSMFTKLALENPSRMTHRRIYETVGIRYRDAALMDAIVGDVRSLLRNHADIDQRETVLVNFNRYAASSLEFFVYCHTRTTNWVRYHEVKQQILLSIIRIVHSHGGDFAFPTTTLDGIDPLLENTRETEFNEESDK
ncbi:MAG: mechanosensitive ion channel family protein [Gammaproteobacteria bacterium]|nr:mechanosensitive ion channel family protein [Pseudomonadales bacterium]MCP5346085.1 mechanosensitive ion channel family protein [Pseudomonadales bacterium]